MKFSPRPDKTFLTFGILFGAIFLFLTPPFQVPDEFVHFYRSYQVSRGSVVDSTFPASVVRTTVKFGDLPFHPEKKTSYREILSLLSLPLEPQVTSAVPSIAYPPLAYLPQALGILVGRLFQLPPLALMYLGRGFNLACWLCLVWAAVRRTPILKWVLCLLALSPMSLFEAASLSKDPLINGASFLLIACYWDAAFGEKARLDNRDLLTLFLLLLLAALPKSVYAVLGLLFFLIPVAKVGSRKKYFGYFLLTMSVLFAILVLGNQFFLQARSESRDFSGWQERLRFIFEHPLGYLGVLFRSLLKLGGEYFRMFIGVLGWLDTVLPKPLWMSYGIALVAAALLDKNADVAVPRSAKLLAFAVFVSGIMAIMTTMYLAEVPRDGMVSGVQGRYFIPLAPLFLFLLYPRRIRPNADSNGWLGKLVVVFVPLALGAASYAILARYYL